MNCCMQEGEREGMEGRREGGREGRQRREGGRKEGGKGGDLVVLHMTSSGNRTTGSRCNSPVAQAHPSESCPSNCGGRWKTKMLITPPPTRVTALNYTFGSAQDNNHEGESIPK